MKEKNGEDETEPQYDLIVEDIKRDNAERLADLKAQDRE